MPELPDIELYLAALRSRVLGRELTALKPLSITILKTFAPPVIELSGKKVLGLERLGKRVVVAFEGDLYAIIHLMVSGRFRWLTKPTRPDRITHADFVFGEETLRLTEASKHKRASISLAQGRESMLSHDPGGVDPLAINGPLFQKLLGVENRTLKRFLTNPKAFSGIGNAYSDEILHRARLSPIRLTGSLTDAEIARLCIAIPETLIEWREKLLTEFDGGRKFPGTGEITAFRPDFATHGKFGKPCPVCGAPIQRIVYAENETNYCAVCQNNGVVLADRAMSRLLKSDWPRTLEGYE
jgi:formamidopyrimidine-DNA glycosylase